MSDFDLVFTDDLTVFSFTNNFFVGVLHLMNEDLKRPVGERYIHGFTTTTTGGRILFTANYYLLTV